MNILRQRTIRKVAMLVRTFAQLGCEQLQVNSLNAETLREAQLQPELNQDLIRAGLGMERLFLRSTRSM